MTAELDLALTWHPKPEHIPQLMHAGAALIRLADNRGDIGNDGQAKFGGRHLEQGAGSLRGQRRYRIGLRHRRKEWGIDAQARDAHLPLGLGVVGFHLLHR